MKTVFRIDCSSEPPELRAIGAENLPPGLLRFNGESKLSVWPKEGLQVVGQPLAEDPFTFYGLAPGVVVYSNDLLIKCEDFYWLSREGAEGLQLRCGSISLEAANIVDFVTPETGCNASRMISGEMLPPAKGVCAPGLSY